MVTRLFASKSSSSSSGSNKTASQKQPLLPPPPPPISQKPKSLCSPTLGKPPRRRPTNLPLPLATHHIGSSGPSPNQNTLLQTGSKPLAHQRPQHVSKTPPASTFRTSNNQPLTEYPRRQGASRGSPDSEDSGNSTPFSYSSFTDTCPTYGFLDLTRTRSDESLLWTAEEEASALVAELRASLNCNNTNSDNSINCLGRRSVVVASSPGTSGGGSSGTTAFLNPYCPKQNDAYTGGVQMQAAGRSVGGGSHYSTALASRGGEHTRLASPPCGQQQLNPFQRSFSVHKRTSEARIAAQKLNYSPPLRSHSFTDLQSAVELIPLQCGSSQTCVSTRPPSSILGGGGGLGSCSGLSVSGRLHASPDHSRRSAVGLGCGPQMKTFGGSWKSLLRVGAMSGRASGKPPGAGIKKVAPPTVPPHHTTHIRSSDTPTPSHTPTHSITTPPSNNTNVVQQPPSTGGMINLSPDTPTGSTNNNKDYRHSGSSFHSSSTASSGVYCGGADQRASFSSSVGSSEDAASTHSSNPPPSPCSPSSGTSSLDSCRSSSGGGGGGRLGPLPSASSPSHYATVASVGGTGGPQFTFPAPAAAGPQFAHLLCKSQPPNSPQLHHLHNSPHHHHHQHGSPSTQHLPHQQPPSQVSPEDQGIDVQSPVRSSSPGSGSGSSSTGSTASTGCCRNSTTSLDSGRASTTTQHLHQHQHHSHHHNQHPHHQHRLSGQSYDSGSGNANGSLRHSYHSSSSSIGSIESPLLNVSDLLNNGVRDCEVLRAWLTELHLEEYTEKFLSAGYDLPTISRMTPEDLNAIGVTKPAHRKKLKTEISRLNIGDGLPDYIPAALDEWLSLLRLSDYSGALQRQGYSSPLHMMEVMWEDLEDVGITRLGHQKKVMLAIKRLKDIKCGKKFSSTLPPQPPQQAILAIARDAQAVDACHPVGDFRTFSGQQQQCYSPRPHGTADSYNQRSGCSDAFAAAGYGGAGANAPQQQQQQLYISNGAQFSPVVCRSYAGGHHGVVPGSPLHRQTSQPVGGLPIGSNVCNRSSGSCVSNVSNTSNCNGSNSSNYHHPQQQQHGGNQYGGHVNQTGSNSHPAVQYRPDFVTVQVHPQVRRSKDGVFEEPIYSTFHPDCNRFSQYQPHQQQQHQQYLQLQHHSNQFSSLPPRPNHPVMVSSFPPRSLDDGDITPTNELTSYEGGGTLPRHRASNNNKFRPVAKVTAKTRVEVHQEMSNEDSTNCSNSEHNKNDTEASIVDASKSFVMKNKSVSNSNKIENIYNMIHSHSTNNTPQGTPKKLPPPPPRRSNSISESSKLEPVVAANLKNVSFPPPPSPAGVSNGAVGVSTSSNATPAVPPSPSSAPHRQSQYGFLRRSLNYGYMGVKNNLLQSDDTDSDPPPPPAPNDVGNHQHILHHPSHRRPQQMVARQEDTDEEESDGANGAASNSNSNSNTTNNSEVDFPPPPPPIDGGCSGKTSVTTTTNTSSSTAASQAVVATSTAVDETVVMRPRRNDSTVSNCSHKSTSSTDSSDSIPFANDNAGTIKQRYNITTTTSTVTPHTAVPPHLHPTSPHVSPHASPSAFRRTPSHRASLYKSTNSPARSAAAACDDRNNDVLSDIGNMLANLTDELDAMLEQEMAT